MVTTADPSVPDLSFVRDLQPGVAYAVLAVIALIVLTLNFGKPLRDRLSSKPKPEPATPTPAEQTAPALPAAMDRTDRVSTQFIDHLLAQIQGLHEENDEREQDWSRRYRELEQRFDIHRRDCEIQINGLRLENERLRDQLWRRGG